MDIEDEYTLSVSVNTATILLTSPHNSLFSSGSETCPTNQQRNKFEQIRVIRMFADMSSGPPEVRAWESSGLRPESQVCPGCS